MRRVVYLGPDAFRVYEWRGPNDGRDEGTTVTFVRDEPLDVPKAFAEHLMTLNPRGCTLETARDYGAQLFAYMDKESEGE